MKALILLFGAINVASVLAEEPPKWTQMQQAILVEPDIAKIGMLIESGIDPNAPIGCGTFAPLDGAISRQNPELLDLLISLGAKPTESQMVTAAFCSSHESALKIVTSLHKAGVSINAKEYYDKSRYSMPIHKAVWRHNTELVAYLIKQDGIQLDTTDVDGYTPLMIAVEHGREDIVDMLLTAGSDPKTKNKKGLDAVAISSRMVELQTRIQDKIETANKLEMATPRKPSD